MVEDFWEWLPKAYRDGDLGDEPMFTKYNMETAFAAGAEAEAEAKRMWVGLTEEETQALYDRYAVYQEYGAEDSGWFDFARAIEAWLREKNT